MKNKINKAKLTLVGAGPGDPDLITLKGVKALQKADVVLYDALANPALLAHAPDEAIRIYVGKKVGNHRFSQEEIQQLIIRCANQYGHVVRLKGGDPFVFGRGQEEVDAARKAGIEVEVVPGISSSIAGPASQGISATIRGVNESFWVITATTRNGDLSADLKLAAQSEATVIILMGTRKADKIAALYQQQGRTDLPVAVIQNATCENETFGLGRVGHLSEIIHHNKLSNPAIIVIGEVVKSHPEWSQANADGTWKSLLGQIENLPGVA